MHALNYIFRHLAVTIISNFTWEARGQHRKDTSEDARASNSQLIKGLSGFFIFEWVLLFKHV